jgi:sugar phosphate isomerase/epimerase
MEIGYRIIRPEDVGAQPLRFAQISLWRTADWGVADGERAVNETIQIAGTCRQRGIRTVFHPLEYPLTGEHAARTMDVMRRLASAADLGIIIHDEGGAGGQRLSAAEETSFEKNLRVISALTTVSIENAFNSGDITRFWERFVVPAPKTVSITLDIGHLESADIDSIAFVRNMPEHLLGAERYGIKDHWPLVSGCREIEALRVLLSRKPDLRVILELETKGEGVRESIELLRTM